MGDLSTQSIRDIWNSDEYQAIRKAHVAGELDDYKLCRGCDAVWQDEGTAWNLFSGARGVLTGGSSLPVLQSGSHKSSKASSSE